MTLSAAALLEGPRGRRLCMAAAHRLSEPVWPAWLHAAWHSADAARRAALVVALQQVDPGPLRQWPEVGSFTGAVADSVGAAMYWQEPDEEDVVAAASDVVEALRPIAEAIAAAPGAQWWSSPLDLTDQWCTRLHDPGEEADEPDAGLVAVEELADWRRRTVADDRRAELERPADPAAPYSGAWWSTPSGSGLVRTTRGLPGAGTPQLFWVEDTFGEDEATLWPATVRADARVYEIDGPEAWTALVRRYPLDVSRSRRHEWFRVTGRAGEWRIPDWAAVGRDWDAVHLTVAGYLSTATRCLPLDRTTATMLAGFDPDETIWLTDAVAVDPTARRRWTKLDPFGGSETEWEQRPDPA